MQNPNDITGPDLPLDASALAARRQEKNQTADTTSRTGAPSVNDVCDKKPSSTTDSSVMKQCSSAEDSRSFEFEKRKVSAFARLMLSKLFLNRHKGDWSDESILWLLNRLRQEVDELAQAIASPSHTPAEMERWQELVAMECADVANFAMMIADVTQVAAMEVDSD